jgi:hypothetical protein
LNDLEFDNPSVPNVDDDEEVRRSISSMVPTAIDPNDSLRLQLLAIFLAKAMIPGMINIVAL